MKYAATILLLLFTMALATPTVIGAIKKSCDTSCCYDLNEEELHQKELKGDFVLAPQVLFIKLHRNSCVILSENLSRHDNISAVIFSPPPEQV